MPVLHADYLDLLERSFSRLDASEYFGAEAMIRSFQARFPPSKLRRLQGVELLEELHGRESRDCLAYWLEFRDQEDFQARLFGSIRGGSALKFGIYQRAEDGGWYVHSGEAGGQRKLHISEAVRIAETQRDQLLAARDVVARLPSYPTSNDYGWLQAEVEAVAPDLVGLAFLHKYLFLQFPDRLDDYHSVDYQRHHLLQMGVRPPDSGLYSSARTFVEAWHDFRRERSLLPMSLFTHLLNTVNGPPCRFWRLGTTVGSGGESQWKGMAEGSYIAVGWAELGDLYQVVEGLQGTDAKEAIRHALARHYPDVIPQQRGKEMTQLWRFFANIQEGDRVFAADGQRIVGVGRVTGPYRFEPGAVFPHRRSVEWLSLERFNAPDKTGLQTTVYPLDNAIDLLLAGVEHVRHRQPSMLPPGPARYAPPPLEGMLSAIHEELLRKGQVILYGPPGTGKTWHALRAAEELSARSTFGRSWLDLSEGEREGLRGAKSPGEQRFWACTFHPAYGYEEFVEGIRPQTDGSGTLGFAPREGLFRSICAQAQQHPDHLHFLLIDEFNRGDAARIFGELLTLLELDKRGRVHIQLPYSRERFSVPRNVRIIATMNTSDRSIALLDSALRRRFGFIELLPDPTVLKEAQAGGVVLKRLLVTLNQRLVRALPHGARNLQVGHSFFQRDGSPLSDFADFRRVMRHEVVPLLQEYCYDQPVALLDILGNKLLDASSGEIRNELFSLGNEDHLRTALREWDPTLVEADAMAPTGPEEGVEE
ncbi:MULTISPECIES: AAA family ATPase [Myxococcus]|uniref:AAA family ATPase n=1 Tax=Myxococcus TaxID=32 RepID=UPI00139029F7|nr:MULTISPECIES: AAA family ATPase [Myxococcus]NOK06670.1 AAA domain-containing protein [Myxococcus xanthus]